MTTTKYDLHTIDYSVQGWDAIMAADIAILDAMIHTRIAGTGGETGAQYSAVYFKSDGKYWKAKADGTMQPCMGLLVESMSANVACRIQRIGPITNAAWSWTVGGLVYLDPSTAGALTQTDPVTYRNVIGIALSATSIFLTLYDHSKLVTKALFTANTIIKADSANVPAALTIAEQTLIGRITSGVIAALTAAQVKAMLGLDNFELSLDTTTNGVGAGYLAYIDAGGLAAKSDATDTTKPAIALVVESGSLHQVGRFATVAIEAGITITKNDLLYLSKTTPGTVTNIKPPSTGNIQQVIGIAKANGTGAGGTVDTVFNISLNYVVA